MLRVLLGAVVLLGWLSACTSATELKECNDDSRCEGGLCIKGYCVAVGEDATCTLPCHAYEACIDGAECVPRYTLALTPDGGTFTDTGPVAVQAELKVRPGFKAMLPDHLDFSAVASDGGVGGTFSGLAFDGGDEGGVYTAQWMPPGEGRFTLTATFPEDGGAPPGDGGLSGTTDLTVNLPPIFVVLPPTRTPMASDGGFVYADSMAPTSWSRDQTVAVRIESDSTDVDVKNVSVVVHGFDGGVDLTGLPVTAATDCSRVYCGSVDVPLWKPGLPAFRGTFKVEVTAKDNGGLVGTASATLPVTRWKWSFAGGAGAVSSPAIGQLGTVYFGTSDSKGKVFALNPEGTGKWTASLGSVKGSPAVGTYSAGLERVYVGVAGEGTNTSFLYALGANGTPVAQCTAGTVLTAVALLSTQAYGEPASLETAAALDDNNSLLTLRAGASGSKTCIPNNASTSAVLPGASVIAKGSDVYFADNDAKIQSLTFNGGGALTNAMWGVKSGYTAPTIGAPVLGLGVASTGQVVGAAGVSSPKVGGVFAITASDGTVVFKNPTSFDDSPVRNLSIGPGNVLVYGREVAGGDLTLVGLPPSTGKTTLAGAGSFPGAPILGAADAFYTASSVSGPLAGVGEVTAWSRTTFNPLWKLSDTVGLVQTSPTLDCARNPDGSLLPATYGVLYVPSRNGSLYAFVVDSPGLDVTAPWPKYQHDVRNTGNPDTPMTACPTQ